MECPKCHSPRIQRDYDDAALLVRLVGRHRLLCNNCGFVFSGFDPLGKVKRKPKTEYRDLPNRRRAPRYHSHLPTAISLVEGNFKSGKVSYSEPSRGHCETISKLGMGISLVGARFPEHELTRPGRLLFVRIDLPAGSIEAVVTVLNYRRVGEERKRKWALGVNIYQMSEADTERLATYLQERGESDGHVVFE
jgi:rubredoxin